MLLGYYISPTKSTLVPTQAMIHLGFGIDSRTSSYTITDKYRKKFKKCRQELLERGSANLHDLQSWVGKCNHLRLVFPGNSLFTFEARLHMSSLGDDRVPLPQAVLDEISFWSFVDTFTDPVPFLLQEHASLRLYTDASGYGWGASVSLPSGPLVLNDYWSSDLFQHDICCKEALAVLFALQSLESSLFRRRVDIFVDNEGLMHAWSGLKSRSAELVGILQSIFLLTIDLRISLKMIWVSTHENPADAPSRLIERSDSMLSNALRCKLWLCYGPFSFDLMALPSNVFRDPSGRALPFFSRVPSPSSSGTNVFAQRPPKGVLYVYPPFTVISHLIRLLVEWGSVTVIMILPTYDNATPVWQNLISPYILDALPLFQPSSTGVLCIPSSSGYCENMLPLKFGLTAYRCQFPPSLPMPPAPALPPIFILILGDSMLRPLLSLSWPKPFRVLVRAYSGASLRRILEKSLEFSSSLCHMLIFHGGVNDASRGGNDFLDGFSSSCQALRTCVASSHRGRSIFLSTICQTRLTDINSRVGLANGALREVALVENWGVISNDNIRITELSDDVHLNAAGTAKLHRNILMCLKSFKQ